MKKMVVGIVVGGIAAALAIFLYMQPNSVFNHSSSTVSSPSHSDSLSVASWQSINTDTASKLSDYRGKLVLMNFWATTCSTCMKEMPMLEMLHTRYQAKNFTVIAVAMPYDDPIAVKKIRDARNMPFPVGFDKNSQMVAAVGGVDLTPTSILFDQEGHPIKRILGAPKEEDLAHLIEINLK